MLHSQTPHDDNVDNNSTSSNTSDQEYFDTNSEDIDSSTPAPEHPNLLAYATKQSLPPGDLRRVLSSSSKPKENATCSQPHQKPKPTSTSVSFANIQNAGEQA